MGTRRRPSQNPTVAEDGRDGQMPAMTTAHQQGGRGLHVVIGDPSSRTTWTSRIHPISCQKDAGIRRQFNQFYRALAPSPSRYFLASARQPSLRPTCLDNQVDPRASTTDPRRQVRSSTVELPQTLTKKRYSVPQRIPLPAREGSI